MTKPCVNWFKQIFEIYGDSRNIDDGPGDTGVVDVLFLFIVLGTPQIFDSVAFTDVSLGLQIDAEPFCSGIY
jgi:hypothetical protein